MRNLKKTFAILMRPSDWTLIFTEGVKPAGRIDRITRVRGSSGRGFSFVLENDLAGYYNLYFPGHLKWLKKASIK